DEDPAHGSREVLNIFIAERDDSFDLCGNGATVMLGSAQMLADQPEFASNLGMRGLLELTERRDLLRRALEARRRAGLSITIGWGNIEQHLRNFTLVA